MRTNEQSRSLKSSPITLIAEGLTEQFYFKHIRSFFEYHYTIKPYFFGTTSFKDMDTKIKEVIDYGGTAVCVFDTDVSYRNAVENERLIKLRNKYSGRDDVIFCDSHTSIEYWFLLHFENTNRYFKDSASTENELRKFIKDYDKKKKFLEDIKWVSELCKDNKLELAKSRAKEFGSNGESYSNVYKAFEIFDKTKDL